MANTFGSVYFAFAFNEAKTMPLVEVKSFGFAMALASLRDYF